MTSRPAAGRLTLGVLVLLTSTALAPAPVQAVDREYPVRGLVVEVNRVQKSGIS